MNKGKGIPVKTLDSFLIETRRDPAIASMDAEMQPSRDVAHLLVAIRQERGLNQRQFAAMAGVSPAYISRLESGLANPSVRALGSLLRGAGLTLDIGVRAAGGEAARSSGEPITRTA